MHAENKQDNHRTERTGIKTSKQHCSWRDVYALMDVDPSIDPPSTGENSSRAVVRYADGESEGNDEPGDTASSDEHTVIA